jgi:hypothetical protein
MKNTAINTLKYTGIVTISQYIGSKKIKLAQTHNAGGNSLFNFLADCLVGDFSIATLNRPTKIRLLNHSTTIDLATNKTVETYTPVSDFLYLYTKPEKVYDISKGIVRYSFAISRDTLESGDFNSIGLYNDSATGSDTENFAAFCEIEIPRTEILASSLLVVDWELIISNMSSTSNI